MNFVDISDFEGLEKATKEISEHITIISLEISYISMLTIRVILNFRIKIMLWILSKYTENGKIRNSLWHDISTSL